MATIIKRNGKWQVKIRKNNFKQLSKTFITKDNAIKWAMTGKLFISLHAAMFPFLQKILRKNMALLKGLTLTPPLDLEKN